MKTNWQTKKLGDIAKIQAGYGFSKDIQGKTCGDFPFIKVGDMNYEKQEVFLGVSENYLDQEDLKSNGYKTIPAGTIIFPKIGGAIATNKKRILAVDSLYDNNVMGIVPTEVVLSEYLYYWLNTKDLSDWASGTSLPAINKSTVEAEEIPLPPLATQRQIVTILDEKFAKLREAKRLREEAIVDTEKILSATLGEIFKKGKEKGWEEEDLGDICEIARGGSPRPIQNYITDDPNGVNWIKISDASDSTKYIYTTRQKITKEGLHKTRMVYPGDFILTNSMSFGRPYIMKTEGAIHDGWLLLRPKKELTEEYLYYFLNSDDIYRQFKQLAGGAVVQNLNSQLVKGVKILIPSLTEQKEIVTHLDTLSEKLRTLRELQVSQLADMKQLEKAYLREAFRGELTN